MCENSNWKWGSWPEVFIEKAYDWGVEGAQIDWKEAWAVLDGAA